MNKIWVISDTHFGHGNIMKYESRPPCFDNFIVDNINKSVRHNELLIHLGDVCLGNLDVWHTTVGRISPFIRTVLCTGNHDGKSINWYINHGFDFACRSFSMRYGGYKILFSHRPIEGDYFDLNIHGHCHSKGREEELIHDGRHILVEIETNGLMPVTLDSILERIK